MVLLSPLGGEMFQRLDFGRSSNRMSDTHVTLVSELCPPSTSSLGPSGPEKRLRVLTLRQTGSRYSCSAFSTPEHDGVHCSLPLAGS